MKFLLFNLKTLEISKKSWKTYKGALKNCGLYEIVSTQKGINWALRHPEWRELRIKSAEDDENTIYLSSDITLKEIDDTIEAKWPNINRELIKISCEHRQVRCLGYDQYDSNDYEDYIVISILFEV